jgi:hypothetical protein
MISELEERYKIELRKKALIKAECDKAYMKGLHGISSEALKMSHFNAKSKLNSLSSKLSTLKLIHQCT